MYEQHFGLTERPFSIAPDPRFIYMSPQHREALAHLLYGVGEGGGFVQLTGEVGTGKTTICRCLVEQLPDNVDVALILNPRISGLELVASLCDELNIRYPAGASSIKVLTDWLNAYLLDNHANGRRTVLVIDEAQNLTPEALEQVRLLTNLETTREKLLQIVLVGQPELRDLLARDELRQLAQRITARYHLLPISREQTGAYIHHRLKVCGLRRSVFEERAIDRIHKLSQGIPRLINILCDRAMLGAFVEGRQTIDTAVVGKAAREVLPETGTDTSGGNGWLWVAAGVLSLSLGLGVYFNFDRLLQLKAGVMADAGGVAGQVSGAGAAPGADMYESPAPPPLLPTAQTPSGQPSTAAVSTQAALPAPAPEQAKQPVATPDRATEVIETAQAVASPPRSPDRPAKTSVTDASAASETASPASAPEVPRGPDLAELLKTAGSGAAAKAWAGLYRLWGYDSAAANDKQACAQAAAAGLRCMSAAGSWGIVRRFDRPAILMLVSGDGRLVPVLMPRAADDRVVLEIDEQTVEVSRDELEAHWYGLYRLLWQKPPAGTISLHPGGRSNDVGWLRERLQRLTGMSAPAADPRRYDAGLKSLVASIQRKHGLTADGVAGARTFILLNNLDDQADVPRLSRPSGEDRG